MYSYFHSSVAVIVYINQAEKKTSKNHAIITCINIKVENSNRIKKNKKQKYKQSSRHCSKCKIYRNKWKKRVELVWQCEQNICFAEQINMLGTPAINEAYSLIN